VPGTAFAEMSRPQTDSIVFERRRVLNEEIHGHTTGLHQPSQIGIGARCTYLLLGDEGEYSVSVSRMNEWSEMFETSRG
jgi:hypothetical protein